MKVLNYLYNKIKAVPKVVVSHKGFSQDYQTQIISVYQKILGRMPDKNEIIHWQTTKASINSIKQVLIQSYEYQQKILFPDVVLVHINSFKIYAMLSDLDIGNHIIQSKSYEPHVTHMLSNVLEPSGIFLDLGANIGYFSLLASKIVGCSGKIISFEPNIQNIQLFYSSIVENQFNNIYIYPFAVSDTNQIYKIKSFGSNGFLEPPKSSQRSGQFTQSVVIDKILQNEERIDVIKIDIEGYEPLALRGMNEMVRKHKPVILTEFSPWHIEHRSRSKPHEYLQEISNHGYCLSVIEQSGCARVMANVKSLVAYWESLNNDKQHLDLIAQPLEKSTSEEFETFFKSVNKSTIPYRFDNGVSLYQTIIGDYYLPDNIDTDIVINTMRKGEVFEREIIEIAKQYISFNSTVLDVGANFGQMTLIFAELVGESGQIFSFEASDFVFSILEKNISISKFKNINAICKAVYDKDEQTMFFPIPDFQRFGSYGSYGLSPDALSGRKVQTITIDSLNIQLPISFMKIDVQGSDLFVLRGAVETIKRHQMPIVFEYEEQFNNEFHTCLDDYLEFIESIDYRIEKIVLGINYLIIPNSKK
ncbi:MAG: FkbM family methyltransferase [Pseudanabaenaceae cyanobacterium bins.68]|nr:FkbM family methyltransferase [Pseudanabaenaceae cyanobacterium bins.68]